ncbi:transposase [Vreelandella aquamarina]
MSDHTLKIRWPDSLCHYILAYFNGRYTSGFVEGLNNRLKVIKRRCFGLLDAGKLFQRIQIDLQERTGCLSLW